MNRTKRGRRFTRTYTGSKRTRIAKREGTKKNSPELRVNDRLRTKAQS